MTPTIEEVKKVAIECGSSAYAHPFTTNHYFSDTALQAFAQHYYEEGRKYQRESDADFILRTDMQFLPTEFMEPIADALLTYAKAIRNNTGE